MFGMARYNGAVNDALIIIFQQFQYFMSRLLRDIAFANVECVIKIYLLIRVINRFPCLSVQKKNPET